MDTKLDFPNKRQLDESMKVCFKIYIPSTRDRSVPISTKAFRRRIEEVSMFVATRYKGATVDYGIGKYKLKGKIISENVAILTVFTNRELYNNYDKQLRSYLVEKKHSWGQDSIGFEYEEKLIFV